MVVLFVAVRVAAAANDPWLDEIWAIAQTAELASAGAILTSLRQDDHVLHTLWDYALGPQAPALAYRREAQVPAAPAR